MRDSNRNVPVQKFTIVSAEILAMNEYHDWEDYELPDDRSTGERPTSWTNQTAKKRQFNDGVWNCQKQDIDEIYTDGKKNQIKTIWFMLLGQGCPLDHYPIWHSCFVFLQFQQLWCKRAGNI